MPDAPPVTIATLFASLMIFPPLSPRVPEGCHAPAGLATARLGDPAETLQHDG